LTGPAHPCNRFRNGREALVPSSLWIANAPCSYGAFEDTVGVQAGLPQPREILDHIAVSGYDGTDLGPLGWLGEGDGLAEALASRGLALAGGYLELPFTEPDGMEEALGELDRLLTVIEAVRAVADRDPPPRPTLADNGSPRRRANPGRAGTDRQLGLDDAGWKVLATNVSRALDRCLERGFEPTFHHHTTSHVEAPWEIDRLLELTDIGLCLDTGHLLIGGGDPLRALRDWGDRINHLHLKDCRIDVIETIVAERAPSDEVWRRHAFCRLGAGDLDIAGFLATASDVGVEGWLVVEQDGILDETWPVEDAFSDQAANRRYLRDRGL
jgi:inosose dehydratase